MAPFYIYIYMYMCVCVCVCIYIYTHTYIYIFCNSFVAFSWGQNSYLECDAFVCVYFCRFGLHI